MAAGGEPVYVNIAIGSDGQLLPAVGLVEFQGPEIVKAGQRHARYPDLGEQLLRRSASSKRTFVRFGAPPPGGKSFVRAGVPRLDGVSAFNAWCI